MTKKIRRYAEGTSVSVEKSKMEIEKLLRTHGASQFMQGWDAERGRAVLMFRLHGRQLKYPILYPERAEFGKPPYTAKAKREDWYNKRTEEEWKRRWRALLLILKAKLELVASGDSSFDREFLADIMLPDGQTVGDALEPQIEQAYLDGKMPPLLPSGS